LHVRSSGGTDSRYDKYKRAGAGYWSPLRPTQPPVLSGTGNEYRPKWTDDETGMAHSVCGWTTWV